MFTSESVSEGHPDKICDRISDAVLDFCLKKDSLARVACETFATTNTVVVGGEVGLRSESDSQSLASEIKPLVKNVVKEIGYEQDGFHWNNLNVSNFIHQQSSDISQGVDRDGAGDQGIMFGYAVNETEELMPAPIHYSHLILKSLADARHRKLATSLGPDSKSQLTVKYDNGNPVSVDSIVLSTQHIDPSLSSQDVKEIVEPYILGVIPDQWISKDTVWHINPTGKFVIGGPDGDAGLTGRKIIVDTYGGAAPHGGGAFSGKDPTKVDRSAAYIARYLAKNIVASGVAPKCLIQLSYAIGVAEPLSIYVDTYGTGTKYEKKLEEILPKIVDLSPKGIIEKLGLRKPIYEKTASYGHFGRTPEIDGSFSWEKIDLVDHLAKHL
jgi:S-adenosylmethionine synthetase|tara:strand:+ start:167 stop:1315 length:1149 start_codon:yes stop_codon:yes gene_type:complete